MKQRLIIVTDFVTNEQINEIQGALSDIIGGLDNHTVMVLEDETKLKLETACIAMHEIDEEMLIHLNIELEEGNKE